VLPGSGGYSSIGGGLVKTTKENPRISVIIPTYNRAELLAQSLDSLVHQSMPPKEFEVVVVNDGSRDGTENVCERFSKKLPIKYVYQENSGIASAKNLGVFCSRAPILFFFDDDDVADKELLREHCAAHLKHPDETVAVLGYTTWSKNMRVTQVMKYVTDIGQFLFSYQNLHDGDLLDFTYFWGGRSSCKRSLLVRQGVFNQSFRFGCEDVELGYRLARKTGLKVVYHRKAVSYMVRPVTYDEFCRRCEKQGKAQYYFSTLYDDRVIKEYCQVIDVDEKWRYVRESLERNVERVREIETLLTRKFDKDLLPELGNLYWWTFNGFKLKGIVEARKASGAKPSGAARMSGIETTVSEAEVEYLRGKWGEKNDQGPRKKSVLIIDPSLPKFDKASGSLRLFNIIKSLIGLGLHVTFIARDSYESERYIPVLQELGVEVYAGDPAALEAAGVYCIGAYLDLQKIFASRAYETVILSFWHIAEYYLPMIREWSPSSRIIVDSVDIHFLREMREAELKQSEDLRERALETKMRETAVYQKADRLWVITEEDKRTVQDFVGGIPIDIVPNIHEIVPGGKVFEETADLMFVGNFIHRPNEDAVEFLCRDILPRVKRAVPGVKLFIIGNNPTEKVKAFASSSVIVTGYVEDLVPYLLKARISLSPLRYGAGMKGKVGEALSWGLPVVTTSIGAEGMGLKHENDALIADDPEDFARQVVRLYGDRKLWDRLSRNGKKKVEDNWSPKTIEKVLAGIFDEAGSEIMKMRVEKKPETSESVRHVGELTSIVIPVKDDWEYTSACLGSIVRFTSSPYELIVVDNGSQVPLYDNLRKWASRNRGVTVKYYRSPVNLGFAGGCNRGLELAAGKYLVLLNNDTLVTPGWIEGLLEPFRVDRTIGLTGPMSNYVYGQQVVGDCPLHFESPQKTDLGRLVNYSRSFRAERLGTAIQSPFMIGLCIALTSEVVDQIGGLDERFYPGNFEDDDFSVRVQLSGYRIVICGDTFIYHYGNRTFATEKVDYKSIMRENLERFMMKWGIADFENKEDLHRQVLSRGSVPGVPLKCSLGVPVDWLLSSYDPKCAGVVLKAYAKNPYLLKIPLVISYAGMTFESMRSQMEQLMTKIGLDSRGDVTLVGSPLQKVYNELEGKKALVCTWAQSVTVGTDENLTVVVV
jgi:GT2 family glycosyltransferase/glycosyltransferase involved in cell wall biosynthesis